MSIQNFLSLLGGVAVFLYGMTMLSDGLEKLSGGRLARILEQMTSNVFKGVLLGTVVTGIIQSSSATTVMCVGFVNAGILKLSQTVGIIMGANIGTTMTAQILSLGDISSDNIFLSLLKPANLGPLLAVVGIVLYMFIKKGRKGTIGQIALGLGILFIGMKTMEAMVTPLKDVPEFRALFTAFSNPLIGVLIGTLVTALIQSSSASVGILQALSSTGIISMQIALPLIFGQNIGTCITAVLSSIGASKNAKRTAAIHLMFNIIGTVFFGLLVYGLNAVFRFQFWDVIMTRNSIANVHSLFNIGCTALLLPFHKQLVKLSEKLIRDGKEGGEEEMSILDERFLSSPSLALEKAREAVLQMGGLARKNYTRSLELLDSYDENGFERLQETEKILDKLESALDNYLVMLTKRALTDRESALVSELLHALSDFERVGDYAVNIAETGQALHSRGIVFSGSAKAELLVMTGAVEQALALTLDAYEHRNLTAAFQVEPLEEVVDLLCDELRGRHIERLKAGACTIELGTQFLELLINLERVSDHCSNVALYILQRDAHKGDLVREDSHAYLEHLHAGGTNNNYDQLLEQYRTAYFTALPENLPPSTPPLSEAQV